MLTLVRFLLCTGLLSCAVLSSSRSTAILPFARHQSATHMAKSLLGWLPRLAGRPWRPLDFSQAARSPRLPANDKIDEECLPDYLASRYYPVRLGEIIRDQYQVVGKLGYGASSTVWLARDLVYVRVSSLGISI